MPTTIRSRTVTATTETTPRLSVATANRTRPAMPTNEALRRVLNEAHLRDVDVASRIGVDPKTVQRWVAGRLPHPRHRWSLAALVGCHESDLWPELTGQAPSGSVDDELIATYTHRSSVPREVWRQVFATAETEIGILVYSGLFLAEDVDLIRTIAERARAGVRVRLILGRPDSAPVAERGREEGIAGAMSAKVRNAILLYRPLMASGVQIRVHATTLYASLYRADDDLLVNQHIYGVAAAYAPVLHLRRTPAPGETGTQGPTPGGALPVVPVSPGLVGVHLDSFERVWAAAEELPNA